MTYIACFEQNTVTTHRKQKHPCNADNHQHHKYNWLEDAPSKLDEVPTK